jgi:hypothetical protein
MNSTVGKVLSNIQLYTYSVSGKMKIHRNNGFFQRKNGLEKWINEFYYRKSSL